jgi:membrane protein DedA with SNARE-associated domain/pimeloyl-ACP methyl ester carboxylesterase
MSEPTPETEPRRRWLRRLFHVYVVVLAASYVAWFASGDDPYAPPAEGDFHFVREVDRGVRTERRVHIAFMDHAATEVDPQTAPVLLLLHGSPGGIQNFDMVVPLLRRQCRVLVPDLPGFGLSLQQLPDYSIDAHADYLLQLLDTLEIPNAHLVGFSMGGGVALELAERAPERVNSILMLAAIGVQEHETFGQYDLNHGVHGLQLGALTLVRYGFPHFGRFDTNPLNIAYARNFYDTDQRPLRGILERYEGAMCIVHGVRDPLVPFAAALEHERLVPQSDLVRVDASHFLLWTHTDETAQHLTDFVALVESGQARTRADADPERVAAAARPFDPRDIPPVSGPALFVLMLLIAAGTLVSEDLTCIAAGLLVAQGNIAFFPATLACFIGIFIGDVGLFLLGRVLGRPAVKRRPLRWLLTPAGIERATDWFQRRGAWVIFVSRFLPGLRLPTYFAAGILRTNFFVFTFYFIVAGLLWTPLLVGFASWAGLELRASLDLFEDYVLPSLIGFALVLFGLQRVVIPLFSYRGRRLLLGSWRRKVRWQYWSPFFFYPPIAIYALWLALKHRSLTLVTAVNPGIPTGGFVGESKSGILGAFGESDCIARFQLVRAADSPETRLADARAFLDRQEVALPIVLKPDVGQRGSGVQILRSAEALEAALATLEVDHVLQEYVRGPEFGIFYARSPLAEHGQLISITEKRFPSVTGDGEHTLERLILADDVAVCMAPTYLAAKTGLLNVPARGQEIGLVEVGTHSLGATCSDARSLETPELLRALDELSKSFEGFHFGRYDLRAPSHADFRAGRGLKVMELNGLTSESMHIYDERTSLFEGWRTLCAQWRMAFDIARENVKRGARPSSLGELRRELFGYRSKQASHAAL